MPSPSLSSVHYHLHAYFGVERRQTCTKPPGATEILISERPAGLRATPDGTIGKSERWSLSLFVPISSTSCNPVTMSQRIGNTALAYARVWHHADASDRILGKLAERIAIVLMGKHKPIYDAAADCGDYVVVTNARKVKVSGRKEDQVLYRKHTMFPGGLKEIKYKEMMRRKPDEIIRQAVSGMLPKNKLRERRLERLRIFPDDDMGIFQHNIVKRWEDGTLAPIPQNVSKVSTTSIVQ